MSPTAGLEDGAARPPGLLVSRHCPPLHRRVFPIFWGSARRPRHRWAPGAQGAPAPMFATTALVSRRKTAGRGRTESRPETGGMLRSRKGGPIIGQAHVRSSEGTAGRGNGSGPHRAFAGLGLRALTRVRPPGPARDSARGGPAGHWRGAAATSASTVRSARPLTAAGPCRLRPGAATRRDPVGPGAPARTSHLRWPGAARCSS